MLYFVLCVVIGLCLSYFFFWFAEGNATLLYNIDKFFPLQNICVVLLLQMLCFVLRKMEFER